MAEYTFDVQKLYMEMLLADAESFARAQNIFKPESFDRKLQPIAKFIKDYMDEYKVMPEVEQVNAKFDIKLKISYKNRKLNGTFRKLLDVSLAKKYGWRSKISFSKGIIYAINDFLKKYNNTNSK